jgi:hypothetical protein
MTKELDEQMRERRQKANEEVLKNLSTEEKVLLKRLLKDLEG